MNKKFIKMAKNMAKNNAFDFCIGMSIDGDMSSENILDKNFLDELRDVYLGEFLKEINKLVKCRKKEIEKEGGL